MSKKVDSAFLCNLTNKYTIFPVVYPMQSEIELLQLSSEGVVDEDSARSRESKGTVGRSSGSPYKYLLPVQVFRRIIFAT